MASLCPLSGSDIQLMRSPCDFKTSSVLSVLAASTTTYSRSDQFCESTLASVCSMNCPWLNEQVMMLTFMGHDTRASRAKSRYCDAGWRRATHQGHASACVHSTILARFGKA